MKISNSLRKLLAAGLVMAIGILFIAYTAHAQVPVRGDTRRTPWNDQDSPRPGGSRQYSLEQPVSDEAQLHTIAFSGLAFITGDDRVRTAPSGSSVYRR